MAVEALYLVHRIYSMDEQHHTTFCALRSARSGYKPAMLIFVDGGVLVEAELNMPFGSDPILGDDFVRHLIIGMFS